MKTITFKQFIKDYRNHYNETGSFSIADEDDAAEVIFDIYDTDKFEFNFETKIIELY